MRNNLEIITLNTWGGRVGDKLIQFFKGNQETDIFCLQEIFNGGGSDKAELAELIEGKDYELLDKIKKALPNHSIYFRPHLKDYYGLAMLIKKDIQVVTEGDEYVYQHKGFVPDKNLGFHARNIQFATLKMSGKYLTVINFHGLWNGAGKTDTPDRIEQSKNIVRFVDGLENDFILCGDFNLLPDTQAIKIIESLKVRNLIKENNILSTRTSLYTKPDKYADYIFISKDIVVNSFEVIPEEVSDHLALKVKIAI